MDWFLANILYIMSVSKNVFNITDLTKGEKGRYICEVRNQKKVPAIKGKTFL